MEGEAFVTDISQDAQKRVLRSESVRDLFKSSVVKKDFQTLKVPLKLSNDNDENILDKRKLRKRQTWSKSLRFESKELLEKEIKESNHNNFSLNKKDGYIIESIRDKYPEDMQEKYEQWRKQYELLRSYLFTNPDKVTHYLYKQNEIFIVSVVSVEEVDSRRELLAIITTENGDKIVNLNKSILKGKSIKQLHKDQKFLSYIDPRLTKKKTIQIKSNKEIISDFHTLAKLDIGCLLSEKTFKIGVIFWKGDEDYQKTFSIDHCTEEFEKFVNMLGKKIKLKGWKGYSGGLDTSKDQDGEYSIYTEFNGNEIMFHVAPYMNSGNHQRKVHIGNDLVVIVFIDTDVEFSPKYIHTTFNQAYILVSVEKDETIKKKVSKFIKEKKKMNRASRTNEQLDILDSDDITQNRSLSESQVRRSSKSKKKASKSKRASTQNLKMKKRSTYYRVEVLRREDVPLFSPKFPYPYPVFKEGTTFKNWILEKAISAIKASYQSHSFKERIQKNRKQFLVAFAKKY